MEFHTEEVIRLCPYSAIVTLPPPGPHAASFPKIVILEKGTCTLEINDNEGNILQSLPLKEGDAFFVNPLQVITYRIDKSKSYSHRDIYLNDDLFRKACSYFKEGLYEEITSGHFKLIRLSPPSLIYFMERSSFLLGKEENEMKESIRKSLIVEFIAHYLTSRDEQIARPKWINELLRKIDDESFISMSIKDMVTTTNYSHGYVNREFKKYMHCSLKHFVNNRKLELASVILATSDASLFEIVIRLNFTTTSSFITLFKKKFGVTPGQYRKAQSAYISMDEYTKWGAPSQR